MIKINMGCGWRNFGKDWIHIDGGDYSHLDYKKIDNLKFNDNTVDLIYASHVISYFDRISVQKLLKEWYRVLKDGATLRLAAPDFGAIASLYVSSGVEIGKFLGPLYGKMAMGESEIFHKTCYDFNSIKKLLTSVGFRDIILYDWRETCHAEFDDHSQAYIPHMDKEHGTLISLNVECKK